MIYHLSKFTFEVHHLNILVALHKEFSILVISLVLNLSLPNLFVLLLLSPYTPINIWSHANNMYNALSSIYMLFAQVNNTDIITLLSSAVIPFPYLFCTVLPGCGVRLTLFELLANCILLLSSSVTLVILWMVIFQVPVLFDFYLLFYFILPFILEFALFFE